MADWEPLARPPIVEAVVDVAVEPNPATTVDQIKTLAAACQAELPVTDVIQELSFGITANRASMQASHNRSERGMRFRDEPATRVFQAKLTGFTYNIVGQYTGWTDLRAEAARWLREYIEVTKPVRITRLGIRTINRVALVNGPDINDTFRTAPIIAPELPQGVVDVFYRLVIPFIDGDLARYVSVVQAQDGPSGSMIFDVEAFRPGLDMPPDDDHILPELDALREIKNDVFFHSLTPEALERYR
jgi:uncharacterized protein (TIGR04255 family)